MIMHMCKHHLLFHEKTTVILMGQDFLVDLYNL